MSIVTMLYLLKNSYSFQDATLHVSSFALYLRWCIFSIHCNQDLFFSIFILIPEYYILCLYITHAFLTPSLSLSFTSSRPSLPLALSPLQYLHLTIRLPGIGFARGSLLPFVYFKSYLLQGLSPLSLISFRGNYLLGALSPPWLIYATSPLQPRLHKTLTPSDL